MVVSYVDWRGQTCYLHKKVLKNGRLRYYFSTRQDGELLDALPEGYEIYENVNGRVFLRKIRPRLIPEDEVRFVEQELRRHEGLGYYRVDVKDKAITAYEPPQEVDVLRDLLGQFVDVDRFEADMKQWLTYAPIMRFVLQDKVRRTFVAERMVSPGEGDWASIGLPGPLKTLVRKYMKHLGWDSFFELY